MYGAPLFRMDANLEGNLDTKFKFSCPASGRKYSRFDAELTRVAEPTFMYGVFSLKRLKIQHGNLCVESWISFLALSLPIDFPVSLPLSDSRPLPLFRSLFSFARFLSRQRKDDMKG
jgi:hypothetical protein